MNKTSISGSQESFAIFTLGNFFIFRDNVLISESSGRSRRMWEVFKFLLANRGKSFFPEEILNLLWPDKEYSDPNMVMRVQMHRLRQSLKTNGEGESLASNLVFSRGRYQWENRVDCWIDTEEFERLSGLAAAGDTSGGEESIKLYREAIKLYGGDYLPESSSSGWAAPFKVYYRELYLNCVFELIELLKKKRAFTEIIKICEKALLIDYFEEHLHIKLIEAFLAKGMAARARAHYDEATMIFYREMGIIPSDTLKNLYRIAGQKAGAFELDLDTIQEGLSSQESAKGSYLCDPELFRYFYKLERLRSERSGKAAQLCLLTLTGTHYQGPPAALLEKVMDRLRQVILGSLRKGDIVTCWNEAQFLILLPGVNREQAVGVLERIENNYRQKYSFEGLNFHTKIGALLPLNEDARLL